MSTHDDEHGPGADPRYTPPQQYGQPPQQSGQPYGGQQYQPSPYGPGQPPGQPGLGQQYGPPGYPPQYGQPGGYGPYAPQGQYGQYGQTAVPARPTPVVVAAVLGFVFGAFGVLVSLGLLLGGAVFGAVFDDLVASDPAFQDVDTSGVDTGQITGVLVVLGAHALLRRRRPPATVPARMSGPSLPGQAAPPGGGRPAAVPGPADGAARSGGGGPP